MARRMTGMERRLARLEQKTGDNGDVLAYVAVDSLDDLDGLAKSRPVKLYIGFSPDEWDEGGSGETSQPGRQN
jgi:hypothetical protein